MPPWHKPKPLVDEAIDQDPHRPPKGLQMLFYPTALPLSRQTLTYTAGIIRRHRKQIGSPWRKLNPGQQALLVLACLRKGETYAELAAGFGVSTATAWRDSLDQARAHLGDEQLERAYARGVALTPDKALDLALPRTGSA
jgi:transposase-like protein